MTKLFALLGIALSFVVASMLNVYPLLQPWAGIRPMFVVLVLIFWLTYAPKWVGVGVAFFVGLLSDLLFDTHLGHQALSAVVMAFFVRLILGYTKRLSFESAWILAIVGLSLYRFCLWGLQSFSQQGLGVTGIKSFLISLAFYPVVWLILSFMYKKINQKNYEL